MSKGLTRASSCVIILDMATATPKQVWLIKKLGREQGFLVDDECDGAHVLGLVDRQHWASLRVFEASRLIELLKERQR